MKRFCCCLILFVQCCFADNNNVLNVLNWTSYMPPSVITAFEKKTGIHVNYSTFDSDDALYTKLALQPNTYDIVGPASYMVQPLRHIDRLQRIDKSRLHYINDLDPKLVYSAADPHGNYCIPNFWGTTGVGINRRYYQAIHIKRWDDLWQPRFRHSLLIPDDDREMFNIALISLGYSPNDNNPQHITQAYHKLQKLLPNVKVFNEASEASLFADGDVTVGAILSGDAYQARLTNSNIQYIYPHDGVAIWLDCLSIGKHAPHLDNAYRFLNFIMQPKVAAQIAAFTDFATPNRKAIAYLPKAMKNSQILYPHPAIIRNAVVESSVKPVIRQMVAHYWQLLKLQS